ncbi:MAG: oligopeptide/dipeptide ABC transporter ATP-binding protein [Microbacterium sp.]
MPSISNLKTLVEVDDLRVLFHQRRGNFGRVTIRAVDGVSFRVPVGTTLGIVGESGSGKSTVVRAVVGLQPATSGTIRVLGTDTTRKDAAARDALRGVQMVFQDPSASLNPRLNVGTAIMEPILRTCSKVEARRRMLETLELVGLRSSLADRLPGQLSGGQQQRVGIARAIIQQPQVIVLDEAVSALDVSVQAQVLNLLADLQERFSLTYIFVSHDLAAVQMLADRVIVLYLGRIMEDVPAAMLDRDLAHPYSIALRSAVPYSDPGRERSRERILLTGDVPSPADPPSGCVFHTRCPVAQAVCRTDVPALRELGDGRRVACHFAGEVSVAQLAAAGATA